MQSSESKTQDIPNWTVVKKPFSFILIICNLALEPLLRAVVEVPGSVNLYRRKLNIYS